MEALRHLGRPDEGSTNRPKLTLTGGLLLDHQGQPVKLIAKEKNITVQVASLLHAWRLRSKSPAILDRVATGLLQAGFILRLQAGSFPPIRVTANGWISRMLLPQAR